MADKPAVGIIAEILASALQLIRREHRPMSETITEAAYFPRHVILAGAMLSGILMAVTMHVFGQHFGLDLGDLWWSDHGDLVPVSAALAWWLVALVAFIGGYLTALLMGAALFPRMSARLQQLLIATFVLIFASAGHAAAALTHASMVAGVVVGLLTLCLGGTMAFSGAYFALRRHQAHKT